jgi:TonB family protein
VLVGVNGRLVLITIASVVLHSGAFLAPFLVGSAEREPLFVILRDDRLEVGAGDGAQARTAANARPKPVRAEARRTRDRAGEESVPGQPEAGRGDSSRHQVTSESPESNILSYQHHLAEESLATSVLPPAASPTTHAPADTHGALAASATTRLSLAAVTTYLPAPPVITDPTRPASDGIAPMTAGQDSARPAVPSAPSSGPDQSGSADRRAPAAGSAERENAPEGPPSERPAGASGRGQEPAARGHESGKSISARERGGPMTNEGTMAAHHALARVAPGTGDGPVAPGAEYEAYLRGFRRRIHELLIYPATARRRGVAGTVLLELIVKPTGEIENVSLVQSSSHPELDGAALDAVRAVRPRPFPPDLPRRALRVHLPIAFELR